jgi:predicted nuclease of predicted toxin-antitoxin system
LQKRVLLDECIPVQLAPELPNHHVRTIRRMAWRGKKNGELLQLAAGKFDVFVTMDAGLSYQQQIASGKLGVVALVASSTEIEVLRPLIPKLRHAVMKVKPGQMIRVSR